MGRMTEVVFLINEKPLPSKRDTTILCPSLSERDRNAIKKIRKDRRTND